MRTNLRVWLFALVRWLLERFDERAVPRWARLEMAQDLDAARAEVLDLIGMTAHLRLRPARRSGVRLRAKSPAAADPQLSAICARRALSRGLLPRGRTLRERITILLTALRRIDSLALRLVARIAKGAKGAWVVAFKSDAPVESAFVAPAAVDTS